MPIYLILIVNVIIVTKVIIIIGRLSARNFNEEIPSRRNSMNRKGSNASKIKRRSSLPRFSLGIEETDEHSYQDTSFAAFQNQISEETRRDSIFARHSSSSQRRRSSQTKRSHILAMATEKDKRYSITNTTRKNSLDVNNYSYLDNTSISCYTPSPRPKPNVLLKRQSITAYSNLGDWQETELPPLSTQKIKPTPRNSDDSENSKEKSNSMVKSAVIKSSISSSQSKLKRIRSKVSVATEKYCSLEQVTKKIKTDLYTIRHSKTALDLKESISKTPTILKKTTRATLMLLPLLGITEFLIIYNPWHHQKNIYDALHISFSMILRSLNGLLVTVLYCFFCKDVRRYYQKWKQRKDSVKTLNLEAMLQERKFSQYSGRRASIRKNGSFDWGNSKPESHDYL